MPAIQEIQVDLTQLLQGPVAATPQDGAVSAKLIVPCHNVLGEGIIYNLSTDSVMWTDILGYYLYKLDLNDGQGRLCKFEMPKKVASFGLVATDQQQVDTVPILCAWEDGFQLYDIEHEKGLSEKSSGEDVNPAKGPTRLNDGKTDPTGTRFICGGFYGEQKGTKMKVFKVEQREGKLVHEPIVEDMEVTNSISWSVDGKTMYLADSPSKQIYSYDYDLQTGDVTNKKLVHTKSDPEGGVPDGTCVDAEGYLWNAVWRAGAGPGMVQRIDPSTGDVVFTVNMPDATSQVTCCCFAGKEMDVLFITTASERRDSSLEPNAGGLYGVKLPFKGKPESKLNFSVGP